MISNLSFEGELERSDLEVKTGYDNMLVLQPHIQSEVQDAGTPFKDLSKKLTKSSWNPYPY